MPPPEWKTSKQRSTGAGYRTGGSLKVIEIINGQTGRIKSGRRLKRVCQRESASWATRRRISIGFLNKGFQFVPEGDRGLREKLTLARYIVSYKEVVQGKTDGNIGESGPAKSAGEGLHEFVRG